MSLARLILRASRPIRFTAPLLLVGDVAVGAEVFARGACVAIVFDFTASWITNRATRSAALKDVRGKPLVFRVGAVLEVRITVRSHPVDQTVRRTLRA